MTTKKIFRLDMFIEFVRQACEDDEIKCDFCPLWDDCIYYLCSKKDEFKKAIIDKFSTEVEVE